LAPLDQQLKNLVAKCTSEQQIWKPVIFDLSQSADINAMKDHIAGRASLHCYDHLRSQVGELLESRQPDIAFTFGELQTSINQHIGAAPNFEYGNWVYYPWTQCLVHVLPEKEFHEIRTSRNRNKITEEEQHNLQQLRLGIVGLSVGQATAVTLALEGIGGEFVLADFDKLELSNMNRLKAGVHDIGLNKAYLSARQIYEFNPYAHIEVFADGITKNNINRFLSGPKKLDMLFEECDDLYVKILLREKARTLGIPVLMETSDRGMIDVERFDLEPKRPLFHGLIETIEADKLIGLTTYEKMPFVMKLMNPAKISRRMAASMVEINTSLKSWPQLASAVALGGAMNADVARRIALGQFNASGRYYVDLENIVSDRVDASVEKTPEFRVEISELSLNRRLPEIKKTLGQEERPSCEQIRALVAYASVAPSGGNCQPWKFIWDGTQLLCFHDVKRSLSFLDYEHRASYLALGAAVENLTLAANKMGFAIRNKLFPDSNNPTHVCSLSFHPVQSLEQPDELFEQIAHRCTNRRLGERSPLQKVEIEQLHDIAQSSHSKLQLLTSGDDLNAIAAIIGDGDRERFLHRQMHAEMMSEVRWNKQETEATRDGIDVATLEFSPTDLAGMRLISSWPVMDLLYKMGAGKGFTKPSKKAVAAASAVGLLTFSGRTPDDWFNGGRSLQRLWLSATQLQLAFQPMTALTYIFERLRCGGEGLAPKDRSALAEIRQRYLQLFQVNENEAELMLFRLARTGPPTARSLRRQVDDILSIQLCSPRHCD